MGTPQHTNTLPIILIEHGGKTQMTLPEFVRVVWIPKEEQSKLTPREIAHRADWGEFTAYPVRIDRKGI